MQGELCGWLNSGGGGGNGALDPALSSSGGKWPGLGGGGVVGTFSGVPPYPPFDKGEIGGLLSGFRLKK